MAHPELDQALGRLAAARLTGSAPGLDGLARPVACPDAETWAAYADGGVTPDEVARLDAHLATCVACRRLVAVLAGEAGVAVPAAAPVADERRGVVLPFRPRATWAWMSMAAALLAAVTVWSVTRLDRSATPALTTADSREARATLEDERMRPAVPPPAAAPLPEAPPAAFARPADDGRARRAATPVGAPDAKELDRLAAVSGDRRDQAAGSARPPAPASGAAANEPRQEKAASGDAKQAPARQITLQTNAAPASARPHGPLANQQSNQNQQLNTPPVTAAPAVAPASPSPPPPAAKPVEAPPQAPPAPASAAAPAPAQARDEAQRAGRERAGQADAAKAVAGKAGGKDAAATDAESKRDAPPPGLTETVSITGAGAVGALGYREARGAAPAFAEPEGRLRWRIAGGRTLESSSDGGATWRPRYSAAERLRAGSAPSIDAAWAVGERGLVLRLAVPGGWTPVARPASTTLVAVSATSADIARVTTEDGRVFMTTDGGRSWTLAPAGPQ